MKEPAKLWTLDGRDNVLLDVMQLSLDLTASEMHTELTRAHAHVIDQLASQSVKYADLRYALVPRQKRVERAFVFDNTPSGAYTRARETILAALPGKELTCSILSGDLMIENQALGFWLLKKHLVQLTPRALPRHTTAMYCVYINNLTPATATLVDELCSGSSEYLGYIDATYSTQAKDWLSTTVFTSYVKSGTTYVSPHEDDIEEPGGFNLPGWPVESTRTRSVSIQSMYFDLFLSYKIERRTIPGERDTSHALSAISATPMNLVGFTVSIDERKLQYIAKHGGGGFEAATLARYTADQIAEIIRQKIASNYIYEMEVKRLETGVVRKFNIMLEFPRDEADPVRMQATLEYIPQQQQLRLITLF